MAKKGLRRGLFITFEGVEGCGKSTHSRLICKYLEKRGYPCVYTKEPGGTKIGEGIRKILLDTNHKNMSDITELFLFEANRSQLIDEVINPALKQKRIVICDRFFDATTAYQGYGNGLNKSVIKDLNKLAAKTLRPDLTLVLDIGIKKGLYRATRRGGKDRMEEKSVSFHKRVRRGYIDIANKEPHRVKLIAIKNGKNKTQALVRHEVLDVIGRYKSK